MVKNGKITYLQAQKHLTKAGNTKAPSREDRVEWIS